MIRASVSARGRSDDPAPRPRSPAPDHHRVQVHGVWLSPARQTAPEAVRGEGEAVKYAVVIVAFLAAARFLLTSGHYTAGGWCIAGAVLTLFNL